MKGAKTICVILAWVALILIGFAASAGMIFEIPHFRWLR
jgi:hypothetical protein